MRRDAGHDEGGDDIPAGASAPGMALVRFASPLVPERRRDEWVAEWEGELHWAWRHGADRGLAPGLLRLALLWRAVGALTDALWLRRRHGAHDMLDLDLKYAVRSLSRRPGFVAVVVLTLALGIGATTAIFSVVNGVLLRPLPFEDPARLVRLEGMPTDGNSEKVSTATSYPDYLDLRAATTGFEHLAAVRGSQVTLSAPGTEPQRIGTAIVTANFFAALGVRPVLGRGFLPEDERPGTAPVVVLTDALWRGRFGGDPTVVGRTIVLDGVATTVVGVLPPRVRLTTEPLVWQPLVPGELEEERGAHRLGVIGRLRPGLSLGGAEVEVREVARRLEQQYPADNAKRGARLVPLHESVVREARPALLVLFGAVALVLLVGCANLASLILARASSREREMAVRAALGAGRGRLVRQWLVESVLLAGAGAAAGLFVAWAGVRAYLRWTPGTLPRGDEVSVDLPVLGFLLGTSLLVALVFALLPALQERGARSFTALRDGGRGSTGGRERRRLRESLVVGQTALATVLVIGAALLIKSFWQLTATEPRFQPDGVIVAQLQLPLSRYGSDSAARVTGFYARLRDEVAAIPGVRAVSFAYEHPLSDGWTSSHTIVGAPPVPRGEEPESRVRPVWPGYFRAVGVPILRGRDVSDADAMDAPGVVVVNEAFVRRHFPNEEAIGRVLDRSGSWWPGQPTRFTIVGVVADEPFLGLGVETDAATYYSHRQFPMNDMWLVVRADGDAAAIAPALRERIRQVDADLPVDRFATMRSLLGESVATPRFQTALLSLFAAVAMLLAAIGIYGTLSYGVAQRIGEIGIRMALGAGRGRIAREVVGQGVLLAGAGIGLGVVAAIALTGTLRTMLVGVSERDPAIVAVVVMVLGITATLAAWLPARRASRTDPAIALRAD
jgi:putative ABC transport system permease protein